MNDVSGLRHRSARTQELRRAKRNSAQGIRVFRPGGTRPPREVMIAFIDAHRAEYGVESICEQLPIAPSTYYEHKAREIDFMRVPPRVRRDRELKVNIQRVWERTSRSMRYARCGGS